MSTNPRFLCALSLAAVAAAQAVSQPKTVALPADRAAGAEAITAERLRSFLERLAGPEFAGRGTGQDGFARAAHFVAEHFAAVGLQPLFQDDDGKPTYLQQVPWTRTEAVPDECRLRMATADGDGAVEATPGSGLCGRIAFDEDATGEVVLWEPPDPDAVADADLTALVGKVVLLRLPDSERGGRRDPNARARRAVLAVQPAALLVVDDGDAGRLGGLVGPDAPGRRVGVSRRDPNSLVVTSDVWQRALALAPGDTATPRATALRAELRIHVRTADAPAFNVGARLVGSDPARAGENVVIGSHLDHLGIQGGVVHPGADDDGSGSAGVMALAEAFTRNQAPPPRSVVLVCFCGEERGLLGSRHFVGNSPIEMSSIVAELQMDMIGRSEENANESADQNRNSLHLIGSEKLSHDLHRLCLEVNEQRAGFDLEWDEEDVFFRSDHYNFARKGVPIAFFFTGFHGDYHRPSDTVERIEFDKLQRVARYVYDIAFELASRPDRPLADEDLWRRNRDRLRATGDPAAPVRH